MNDFVAYSTAPSIWDKMFCLELLIESTYSLVHVWGVLQLQSKFAVQIPQNMKKFISPIRKVQFKDNILQYLLLSNWLRSRISSNKFHGGSYRNFVFVFESNYFLSIWSFFLCLKNQNGRHPGYQLNYKAIFNIEHKTQNPENPNHNNLLCKINK